MDTYSSPFDGASRRLLLCRWPAHVATAGAGSWRGRSAATPPNRIELKFTHDAQRDHPGHPAAQDFVNSVERRTRRQVCVVIYSAAEQGSPPEHLQTVLHCKFYRPHPYISLTHHVYNSMLHVIESKFWQALTPAQKRIAHKESVRAGALMRKEVRPGDEHQLFARKTAATKSDTADMALFRAAAGPASQRIDTYSGAAIVMDVVDTIESTRPIASAGGVK